MAEYFAGVEGGGTHSTMVVTNAEGEILAQAETGATNPYVSKRKKA